jgi:hypothetical protein
MAGELMGQRHSGEKLLILEFSFLISRYTIAPLHL